jgi:hypothetical protein
MGLVCIVVILVVVTIAVIAMKREDKNLPVSPRSRNRMVVLVLETVSGRYCNIRATHRLCRHVPEPTMMIIARRV